MKWSDFERFSSLLSCARAVRSRGIVGISQSIAASRSDWKLAVSWAPFRVDIEPVWKQLKWVNNFCEEQSLGPASPSRGDALYKFTQMVADGSIVETASSPTRDP